ncbi:amino acid ABC transporter permease [Pseudoduganella namucuonensis]|uniref:L-glutamate ABC transporter membrane protein /L-aspartate ABC transporter membrane protein n=1 Tax=Pseudoduganella namucuonensis TaxID=1035707 RepID=A0A1I7L960_9BURK|nr:amino acid ABC transporter permease [Pseudoduganella namucuonensis]SFV06312.1 L-glutamate ABC transporter membrane protein /L-aspartate ABC transporter membrane protein [Pseudoduganella namucuonensis]
MNYHWNWRIFWEESPDGVHTYWETLVDGLQWTMAASLGGWIMALLLGVLVGTARTMPDTRAGAWLRRLGTAYIEIFRNVPLLVQMFLWYFVAPELLPPDAGAWLKALPNAPFVTAVVSLGFYTSARVAVQVTAGIESLSGGQRLAAMALGLSRWQTYRHVLLPLAFRIILPPLTSECLNIIKNSSIALTIGLVELTASARAIQEFSFQVFEAFSAATLIYVTVNILVVGAMHVVERKLALPGTLQSGGTR